MEGEQHPIAEHRQNQQQAQPPAAADLPQTDADANADTLDDGEFFDQAASSDGDSAEKDVAEESKEAEVGNQQADSRGDADEGVERH